VNLHNYGGVKRAFKPLIDFYHRQLDDIGSGACMGVNGCTLGLPTQAVTGVNFGSNISRRPNGVSTMRGGC
jgi:hypothetical protein